MNNYISIFYSGKWSSIENEPVVAVIARDTCSFTAKLSQFRLAYNFVGNDSLKWPAQTLPWPNYFDSIM